MSTFFIQKTIITTRFSTSMPTTSFLLLLALAVSQSIAQTPNSTLSVRNCNFFLDPTAQNFTFLYCTFSFQLPYQTQWQVCIDHCCGGMAGEDYPLPDQQTLLMCKGPSSWNDDDAETVRKVKMICIIVTCSVIFASLLILLCKVFAPCCNNRVVECYGHPQLNTKWLGEAKFVSKGLRDIIWRGCEGKIEFDADRTCSVCLQSNCLGELQCGHGYHANCIGQWLKKSSFCPLCHMEGINLIRKYCAGCRQQYLLMKKETMSMNCSVLDKLRCYNCKLDEYQQGLNDVASSKRRIELSIQKEQVSQSHFQIIDQ